MKKITLSLFELEIYKKEIKKDGELKEEAEKKQSYISKYNSKQVNKALLLMINNGEKWNYLGYDFKT